MPDGVTFSADLYDANTVVIFPDFAEIGLTHVFHGGGGNIGFGAGFGLNINENIFTGSDEKKYVVDSIGDAYDLKLNDKRKYDLTVSPPHKATSIIEKTGEEVSPQNWLISANVTKGYGQTGLLEIESDNHGNCLIIIRDGNNKIATVKKFYINGDSATLRKQYTFTYNSNGNLAKISDDAVSVQYDYSNNRLTKIIYPGNLTLNIAYKNNLIGTINSSNGYKSEIAYKTFATEIAVYSTLTQIPNGDAAVTPKELSRTAIQFYAIKNNKLGAHRITVAEEKENKDDREYYLFSGSGDLKYRITESDGKVSGAENYTDLIFTQNTYEVKKAKPSTLRKSAIGAFVFEDGETGKITYVAHTLKPAKKVITGITVSEGTNCEKQTENTYDERSLLHEGSNSDKIRVRYGR